MKWFTLFKIIIFIQIFNIYLNFETEFLFSVGGKKGVNLSNMSDKELDELLKDPKYASIANGMLNKDGAAGGSAGTSLSPKSELAALEKNSKKLGLDDLDAALKEPLDLSILDNNKKEADKKDNNKLDDKFKNFDFISKQQAILIIDILKQPVFFNMLPSEAQQIVKVKIKYIYILII
jgi:hypothetical protein